MVADRLIYRRPIHGIGELLAGREGEVQRRRAWLGYLFAVINAIVSGVAVFVSSRGVGVFTDPVLFTSLKNGLVGAVLLVPLLASAEHRRSYQALRRGDWAWLLAVALVGGSVPYALYFTGLKSTTAATGALGDHMQFVLVVVLAVVVLGERLTAAMWAGMAALLAGVLLSADLGLLRWNGGTVLIVASTVLFSVEWVVVKYLLRGRLHPLIVMTAKMTIGSALLFCYLAVRGQITAVAHLDETQWLYAVGTGALLLMFTASIFIAIRLVPVSAVLAIGAAAPLITIALQLGSGGRIGLSSGDFGLLLILLAVTALIVLGIRQDNDHDPQSPGVRASEADAV